MGGQLRTEGPVLRLLWRVGGPRPCDQRAAPQQDALAALRGRECPGPLGRALEGPGGNPRP
eukprot:10028287-Lingulodinium_polyedra.AAC.1